MALEPRDIDCQARVVYVRRALRNGRLKSTKTEGSIRAVPLQAVALAALDQLSTDRDSQLLFPSVRGGYFDLHNFRNRYWRPAQVAAGIVPLRRVYDLRHTFATFALRAGISTFDLSRYMGASLTMIDRHYGHLARDGREHTIRLLDGYADIKAADSSILLAGMPDGWLLSGGTGDRGRALTLFSVERGSNCSSPTQVESPLQAKGRLPNQRHGHRPRAQAAQNRGGHDE
jgi:hypothetical protein